MSDKAEHTPGAEKPATAHAATPTDESAMRAQRNRAFKDVFWYGLARLLLFLALCAVMVAFLVVLQIQVPLAIIAVLALIIAMPASVFLFPKLRMRANEGVSVWDANRRAHKQYVRQQLAEREAE
ncbi:DUF4229 domain-containing protein [uncultured Corynebacterium sp.]|uniref:DUF4229 domain-containing protein n=1 Tax=uncultured Corynebacterium sp. TaxID=159447 RepID=UPI0025F3548B|nr:DUF4229 domain-containing protein [uncultured Corynebacterium sp.]